MICKHFGTCGGCSLPGVPYADQLRQKQERLSYLLGMDVPALIPSPLEERFRQKVAFVFAPGQSGRGIVMGHYASGSQRIVPIEECPVHSDRGNRLAFRLRHHLAQGRVNPSILRHVLVRTTVDEKSAVVMLIVFQNDKSLRTPVRAFLAEADRPDGFFVNINDRPGPHMVGRETLRIDGRSHVRENGLGTPFLISPTAFFQTNIQAAAELLRLVMEGVGTPSHVLDLYSGSGLFALPLAGRGTRVTAVEENAQAVRDGEANLRLNRVPDGRVRFVNARVEDALRRFSGRDRIDAVVLDPPRSGCTPGVIDYLFRELAPPRAVYVSCNPDVLAADLPQMLSAGYALERVQAVDMFPHTEHIETVVVLKRSDG